MDSVLEKTYTSISAVVHLGDGWDEIHEVMRKYPKLPLYAVVGNCDYEPGPGSLAFRFSSKKFIITHGHRYNVKSDYLRLRLWAEENEADVCLFGHTHVPDVFYSGRTLLMNPGSIGIPRGQYTQSYGIVDISESGIIDGRVMGKQGGVFQRIV